MERLANWLRNLGLSEYAQSFVENGIDFSVLPDLTEQDLKDIGVLLGHRRKLLRAIAVLNHSPTAGSLRGDTADPPSLGSAAASVGERRHLTIMFCDLVGSTGISARLDAEEWRDLVNAYLETASAEVTRLGGHVAKKLGDGLMVLFGFPVAHENDAERATRAALAIQSALHELNVSNLGSAKPKLVARIGLECGPVVVDAAGEIFGDTPNIAARVQALAAPGAVLITARVQRQISGLFLVEEQGQRELKGVPEPISLFVVLRASGAGHREVLRYQTPLVGRDEEIDLLMRRWEKTRNSEGQVTLVIGEPGLGKSRLIGEFHAQLRDTPHTWVEWGCSPMLQNTPLHFLGEWGRQRFGDTDISAELRLADLENTLTLAKIDPIENAALLAPLLDIPLPQSRTMHLPPEDLRHRQLAALTNWLTANSRLQPLVLIVENLHWADPTTLVLMRAIVDRGARIPLFVLLTARPEFRPPWPTRSHHGTISLAPLDQQQVRHMVAELAARHALPPDVIKGVTERTGGVPLFVEEVTLLLLERGEQGGIQAIPPTLEQSLTARLDRLGTAREVAQVGAVVGRSFSYKLIGIATGMEAAPLQAALDRLADADVLLVEGHGLEATYRFKHSLIQDAAYEGLLKSRRQTLHRRIGEALRDGDEMVEPELLAHHFTQARLPEIAIKWWGEAGRKSLQRSALVEAVEQLRRALELIATLPATPELRREEIRLQVSLLNPLMHVKGYAAPETTLAAERARLLIEQAEALGEGPDDLLLLFSVLYSFWVANHVAFDGQKMRGLADRYLALAGARDSTVALMMGHRLMGVSLAATGDVGNSIAHLDKSVAYYDRAEHRALMSHFGQDILVSALAYRSVALWLIGRPDAALMDAARALEDARQLGQAATLLFALSLTGLTQILSGNYEAALAQADDAISIGAEKDATLRKAQGLIQRGCVWSLTGRTSDGVEAISTGLVDYKGTGATYFIPFYLSFLAKAYANLGQFDAARRSVAEAVAAFEATGELWWEPEIYRVAGEIELMSSSPNVTTAQSDFERAFSAAQRQQAKSWELRAATSLARLLHAQGKSPKARKFLAPVYGWFNEGLKTLDLCEAKELLDRLTP
jgi:predicted ATPase/class 3 adenylate cyclase